MDQSIHLSNAGEQEYPGLPPAHQGCHSWVLVIFNFNIFLFSYLTITTFLYMDLWIYLFIYLMLVSRNILASLLHIRVAIPGF